MHILSSYLKHSREMEKKENKKMVKIYFKSNHYFKTNPFVCFFRLFRDYGTKSVFKSDFRKCV